MGETMEGLMEGFNMSRRRLLHWHCIVLCIIRITVLCHLYHYVKDHTDLPYLIEMKDETQVHVYSNISWTILW